MIAWTRKAVSVAEPSVCAQPSVAGHLAEEEVLDPADEARPLLEPVDRVEHHALDLPAALGLRHQALISGIGKSQNSGPATCWPGMCSGYFLIRAVFPSPLT